MIASVALRNPSTEKEILSTIKALLITPQPTTAHYHSIDLLRGIAAVAVLFWHYQGFYSVHPADPIPAAVLAGQPMYSWFSLLYTKGHYAVELFWTISGFVFAAVYVGSAATTREFVSARFARLYPLHALTLAAICVLELISIKLTGYTKCYANFDLYHFILNIFFASAWGFERGFSFNGPVWSVSIEILVYAVFWATHRHLFKFGILGPAISSIGFFICLVLRLPGYFWECGFFFFAGASIFVLHRTLRPNEQVTVAAAAFLAWAILADKHASVAIFSGILGTVTLVAALETRVGKVARSLQWVGDNTYSIYLWQIPVQVSLLLLISDVQVFNSPMFLIAYLCGMVLLARVSFLLIERPARRSLRAWCAA